ncbi:restriction endonuclease [Hymenobacter baengnokdamensis]|uniref:restriction endonuclease n=1 Tax=Hymenobacter baengnokdamensis TaxID=2615203 RepID=UPI0012454CE6|nr:restriction endonuclease [Hymenobacter baengnokdamensis]
MTIWALKNPSEEEHVAFVHKSLKKGISRFGWSYIHRCDLLQLNDLFWTELNDEQTECFKKASFLLDVEPGDWVVHINVPQYGKCTAAKVARGYRFDSAPNEVDDFRHTLQIDLGTLIEFDRNDANILPIISSRLKLQGRFWRINQLAAFEKSIQNLRTGAVILKSDERAETYHLRDSLVPLLKDFTSKIQLNNPSHSFEAFLAEIFRRIPGVTNVNEHGRHKGFGTDNGADLIVSYDTGLPITGLQKAATLVIQAKSYTDIHWETNAVDQLEEAMATFNADSGLLITTAQASEHLIAAFDKISTQLLEKGKTVSLISGDDVARFALKFGADLLLAEK